MHGDAQDAFEFFIVNCETGDELVEAVEGSVDNGVFKVGGAMCIWMCAWRLNLFWEVLGGGGISMEAALLRLSTNAQVAHRWESLWPWVVFEMRAAIVPYSSRAFVS